MSNVDVELLYGVSGGGDLNGASGQEISKSLNKLVKALERAKVPTIKIFFDEKDFKTKLKNIRERISKELKSAGKININMTGGTGGGTKAVAQVPQTRWYLELKKQIEAAYSAQADFAKSSTGNNQEIENSITKVLDKITKWKSLTDEQRESLKNYASELADNNETSLIKQQKEAYDSLQKEITEVDSLQKQFYRTKYSESPTYQKLVDNETNGIQRLRDKISEANISEQQRSELVTRVSDIEQRNQDGLSASLTTSVNNYNKFVDKVGEYVQRMEKQGLATKEAKQALDNLKNSAKTPLNLTGDAVQDLQEVKKSAQDIQQLYFKTSSDIVRSGASDPTTFGNFAKALTNKFQSMLSAMLITSGARALNQVYQNVLKIETALTQLNITSRLTGKQMTEFMNETTKAASKLGLEVDKLIDSVTEFVRLGYSLKDSSIFAELTAMYSNVTGVTVEETTKNMTALIKAYNINAEQAELVLDKLITVGNNYAISPGELGEAMNEAGSALSANGNTLEEAMGILTAANVTLQNISKSSTAVRTIAARISSSSVDLEELGEDSTNVIATADLDRKMRALGVAITDNNGELRSTFDILNDLSKVWDELTTTERAAVAEMLAGNRQQNAFYSIMANWEDATGAVEDCETAMGTLSSSYDIYLDSIEGKIGQLTATWESFSNNLLDSAMVKFFVDVLRWVAEALTAITTFGNGFAVKAAVIVATLLLIRLAFDKTKSSIDATFGDSTTKGFSAFIKMLQVGAKKAGTALLQMFKTPGSYITLFLTLLMTINKDWQRVVTLIVAGAAAIGLAIALCIKTARTAIKGFMASNPLGWILAALTAIVLVVKSIIDLLKKPSYADLKEAAKEAKEEWKEVEDELSTVNEELDNISKKIDEINSKDSLSLVDKEELAYLEQQQAILEQERNRKEAEAQAAEKDAAKAAIKAVNKYEDTSTYKKPKMWKRVLNGLFTSGVSEIVYEAKENKADTQEEKLDKILNNWNNSSESDKKYVISYLGEMQELFGDFSYYTGEGLESWQVEMNKYLDEYYQILDEYGVVTGDIQDTWDSVFSRIKYSSATDALSELADQWKVNAETLRELSGGNSDVKQFLDYLEELGIFSWDDAESVEALVNQIRELAVVTSVVDKDYLDVVDSIAERYTKLTNAMSDMDDIGILSADTITELIELFPEWTSGIETCEADIESLKEQIKTANEEGDLDLVGSLTEQLKTREKDFEKLKEFVGVEKIGDGYVLSDNSIDKFFDYYKKSYQETIDEAYAEYQKISEAYSNDYATQQNVDDAYKAWETAVNNMKEFETVINTVMKSDLLEDYTDKLESQTDVLDEQLNKFKDIVSIRQDLLKTYQDELDYQKSLAEKQKSVADLQTKLKLAQLDTSASGQARMRELQSELNDAQEELDEYTLEHAISDLTAELDSENEEYEKFIKEKIESITSTIENAAKLTADEIREALCQLQSGSTINTHHTGGFVGGATLKDNEEFAKLLKGELVVTPKQMSKFMNRTLPAITNQGGGSIIYNSPLIEIKCESIDSESLPKFEKIVDKAVKRVKDEIDNAFSRTGKKGTIDKFKI